MNSRLSNRTEFGSQYESEMDELARTEPLVEVQGLKKHFPVDQGLFGRGGDFVRAVDGVDFEINKGETFGLVGESGCGKTTTGRSILRLTEPTEGSVTIAGQEVTGMSKMQLKQFRRNMQIVFQDPTSSLNPRFTVKKIIETPLKVHGIGTKRERDEYVHELIDIIDLPEEYLYKYPATLSGGQKQRVGIARAVATQPKFIVLDEPTSALDVSVQARIISILERLQEEFDISYLFITHDLSLLKKTADQIGVMYLGQLVEVGDIDTVFESPNHPYTKALLSAISTVTEADRQFLPRQIRLEGSIPDPTDVPSGCPFRTRCPEVFEPCDGEVPEMYEVGEDHISRCYLHDDRYT